MGLGTRICIYHKQNLISNKIDDYIICSGVSKSLNSVISHTFNSLKLNRKNTTIDKDLKRRADIKKSPKETIISYLKLKIRPKK